MSDVRRYPLRVWVEGGGDDPLLVVADMRDVSAWEKARHAHKWPPTSEAHSLCARYMAWHALRRTQAPGTPAAWDDDHVIAAEDDTTGGPELEGPTPPGHGPGSS